MTAIDRRGQLARPRRERWVSGRSGLVAGLVHYPLPRRDSPPDVADTDRTGHCDRHPSQHRGQRECAACDGSERYEGDGGDLGPARHAQPRTVVSHECTDFGQRKHPPLEAWARPCEATCREHEEARRGQTWHDYSQAAKAHSRPACRQPGPAGRAPGLRSVAWSRQCAQLRQLAELEGQSRFDIEVHGQPPAALVIVTAVVASQGWGEQPWRSRVILPLEPLLQLHATL